MAKASQSSGTRGRREPVSPYFGVLTLLRLRGSYLKLGQKQLMIVKEFFGFILTAPNFEEIGLRFSQLESYPFATLDNGDHDLGVPSVHGYRADSGGGSTHMGTFFAGHGTLEAGLKPRAALVVMLSAGHVRRLPRGYRDSFRERASVHTDCPAKRKEQEVKNRQPH